MYFPLDLRLLDAPPASYLYKDPYIRTPPPGGRTGRGPLAGDNLLESFIVRRISYLVLVFHTIENAASTFVFCLFLLRALLRIFAILCSLLRAMTGAILYYLKRSCKKQLNVRRTSWPVLIFYTI